GVVRQRCKVGRVRLSQVRSLQTLNVPKEKTHFGAVRFLNNRAPHRFERALVGLLFVHAHSVSTAYEHCAVWAALGDEFGIVETEIASKKQDDFASRRGRKSSGDVDDGGNGEFRSDGALCIVA